MIIHWKRIGLFCVLLALAQIINGIGFGLMLAVEGSTAEQFPKLFGAAQLVTSFLINVTVFFYLGVVQPSHVAIHAFIIGALVSTISTITLIFLTNVFNLEALFLESGLLILAAISGVVISIDYRKKKASL